MEDVYRRRELGQGRVARGRARALEGPAGGAEAHRAARLQHPLDADRFAGVEAQPRPESQVCPLYTSDAADQHRGRHSVGPPTHVQTISSTYLSHTHLAHSPFLPYYT